MTTRTAALMLVTLALAAPGWLAANTPPSLIPLAAELGEGEILVSFAAREGVCGCQDSITIVDGSGTIHIHGHYDEDDDCDCVEGPVRVRLKVRDDEIVRIKTRIGQPWRPRGEVRDLGEIAPQLAADLLLELARKAPEKVAEKALMPAMLGRDCLVWPTLLELARDRSRPQEVRDSALFWLSQVVGDKVTAGLAAIVDDDDDLLEVRETAIFALSERKSEDGVAHLERIARTSPHPQLRRSALFWLAQADDPRILELFEEILLAD